MRKSAHGGPEPKAAEAMVLYYLATDLVPAILVGLALCSFPEASDFG